MILFVLMVKHINVLNIAFQARRTLKFLLLYSFKELRAYSEHPPGKRLRRNLFSCGGKKVVQFRQFKMMKRLFLKVHFSSSDGPQCRGTDMGRI